MPFFITSPISTSKPTLLIMSSDIPRSLSATKPPMKESGADIMMVKGWVKELKREARIM